MLNQIFDFILQLDYKILEFVQSTSSPWQDQFFPWISDVSKEPYFKFIAIPLLIFLFYRKFNRAGISLFLILLLSLAFSDFAGSKVKNYYVRLRPFENTQIQAIQKSPAGSKSFYSNHASNMFTFATYMSSFFPVLKVPLYGLAATVSYSRIYNGVHYPSDVFAGGFMGILWGLLFAKISKRLMRKLKYKKKDASESTSHGS